MYSFLGRTWWVMNVIISRGKSKNSKEFMQSLVRKLMWGLRLASACEEHVCFFEALRFSVPEMFDVFSAITAESFFFCDVQFTACLWLDDLWRRFFFRSRSLVRRISRDGNCGSDHG